MVGVCSAMAADIPSISTAVTTDCTMFEQFIMLHPIASIYMLKLASTRVGELNCQHDVLWLKKRKRSALEMTFIAAS